MKIESLFIENLNSLQGQFKINFNQAPLLHSGIFAITGDTGAGKTTILDAITLALYNQTPRLEGKTTHMISHGKNTAKTQVVFSMANKQRYICTWSVSRKLRGQDKGGIKAVKHAIAEYKDNQTEATPLSSKTREVIKQVKAFTGLGFDEFRRSMMLAQGDFNAFIRAKDKDRAAILEQISGTDIYEKLSIETFKKNKEWQFNYQQLETQINNKEVLNSEALEQLMLTQKETYTHIKKLNSQLDQQRQEQQCWQSLKDFKIDYDFQSEQQQLAQQQQQQFESKSQQLSKHQQALPAYQLGEEQQKELAKNQQIQQKIEQITTAITNLEQQQTQACADVSSAKTQQDKNQKIEREQSPLLERILVLDEAIVEKKKELLSIKLGVKNSCLKVKIDHKKSVSAKKDLKQVQQQIDSNDKVLLTLETDKNIALILPLLVDKQQTLKKITQQKSQAKQQTIVIDKKLVEINQQQLDRQLQQLQQTQQSLVDTIKPISSANTLAAWQADKDKQQQAIKILNNYQDSTQSLAKVKQKKQQYLDERKHKKIAIKQYEKQQQQLEEDIRALNLSYEQALLLQKYAADRANLKPESACPLCGSNTHPYRKQAVEPHLSDSEAIKTNQLKKDKQLKKQQQQLIKLKTDVAGLDANFKQTEIDQSKQQSNQQKATQAYQNLGLVYPVKNLSDCQHTLELFTKNIKLLSTHITTYEDLNQQISQSKTLLKDNKHQQDLLSQQLLTAKITEQTHTDDLKRLEIAINNQLELYLLSIKDQNWYQVLEAKNTIYADLEQKQTKLAIQQQQENSRLDKLSLQTAKSRQIFKQNNAAYRDLKSKLQDKKQQRYQKYADKDPQQQKQQLIKNHKDNKADLKQATENLEHINKELQTQQQQNTQEKVNKTHADTALQTLQSQLSKAYQEYGFSDHAQVSKQILETDVAEQFADRKSIIERELIKRTNSCEDTKNKWEQQRLKTVGLVTQDELERSIDKKEQDLGQQQQKIGFLRKQKNLHDDNSALQQQDFLKLVEMKPIVDLWKTMNQLIGSSDGTKFKKFAQRLTLKQLIMHGNQYLKKLAPRYQMSLNQESNKLELDVIDTYNANGVRAMTSLSGGESFLVSLALALGLGDMQGNKESIDSLFIDEGFGSLDDSCLEIALNALENLQASGKQVGIISHVAALKNRFAVQIQVIKNKGGCSKIVTIPRK